MPRILILIVLLCWGGGSAAAAIAGNYTLSADEVFTSIAPGEFTIGAPAKRFNLRTFTATFSGTGDFQIQSKITGSGSVVIDLTDAARTVEFNTGNTYSGDTIVRSGKLLLDTPAGADNGVVGDLFIGGGPNAAVVTRHAQQNNALIGDTSTISIAANGTLEFNRSSSWGGESLERFGHLILNGGSIVNKSESFWPTVASAGSLTLLSASEIDLGKWMSVLIDDVSQNAWDPNAILTIKNWSPLEPVFMGGISDQQLSQIRFETAEGTFGAREWGIGFVVPAALVPEASTWVLIPLLALAFLCSEGRIVRWKRGRGMFGRSQSD